MARTALDLTAEERRAFHPGREWDEKQTHEKWGQAWEVARAAARLLRERFGARRVVVFGSLARRAWLTPWSDIDLAVWGVPGDQFYRAVAAVTALPSVLEVNLVDPDGCRPRMRQAIERDGIDL